MLSGPERVCAGCGEQVWQAILTKKVDLNSWKMKRSVSSGGRDLLKVDLH